MRDVIQGEVVESNQIVPRDALASSGLAVPSTGSGQVAARVSISIRVATLADLPFLDSLQKKHSKALGFFPRAQMEGYVRMGGVLVAEQSGQWSVAGGQKESNSLATDHRPLTTTPVGYVISRDRYLKRDELGVIYQLCVDPTAQRKLIAAALIGEVFARSAYGCRLYCCWCAKDLHANYFWEALGFVPIAFRAGSRKRGMKVEGGRMMSNDEGGRMKDESADPSFSPPPSSFSRTRVHIFWQKRIVEGDTETKWWYPCQTNQGAIREDRLVFPIPRGVHWKDVEAVAVPESAETKVLSAEEKKPARARAKKALRPPGLKGGLWFAQEATVETVAPSEEEKKALKESRKIDPRLTKMARELRDRWMEQAANVLPSHHQTPPKHDVRRMMESSEPITSMEQVRALPEADLGKLEQAA